MKRELAQKRPDLRFAFSRPGLTTFKVDAARVDEPSASSFARAYGRSLGRATTVAEVLAHAAGLPQPLVLHVFERDPDRPATSAIGARGHACRRAAKPARCRTVRRGVRSRSPCHVIDVIVAPGEEPDDGIFVGYHRHDDTRGPLPGGVPHVAIPPAAPSRAWAKIEEAIRWSGLTPRPGEHAIELGSAPGGASFALLERGLHVHGVDPGAMDPRVLAYAGPHGNRFTHHAHAGRRGRAQGLRARTSGSRATSTWRRWSRSVRRAVRRAAHGGLRGAFITLKLNDDGIFEALPRGRRIGKLGAKRVRYTQLPSHRSEIVAILDWNSQ